jgi:protein-L-isoaspartate(D-aspartate) O-methyltransferase
MFRRPDPPDDERRWSEQRGRMVAEQLRDRGVRSPEVLTAMAMVPRERFVDPALLRSAYDDRALGIGSGQTISQPYMVARMTEVLDLPGWRARHPGEPLRVLDVGTGSGYQAAILAAIGAEVVSIEREPALADEARERLASLDFEVRVVLGDGTEGYPPLAPYAGIVVAAAAPDVPPPLMKQLADDGHLAIPVGRRDHQWLTVVVRTAEGFRRTELEPCVFVPLLGRYGFDGDH